MAYEMEDYDVLMMMPSTAINYELLDSNLLSRLATSEDADIAASALRELSRRSSPATESVARTLLLRDDNDEPYLLGLAWSIAYRSDERFAIEYVRARIRTVPLPLLETVMSEALYDIQHFTDAAGQELISEILRRVAQPGGWTDPRVPEQFRLLFKDE